MKEGKIVEQFDVKSKDGKKLHVVFRYPSKKDIKAAMQMVNRVRDEAEYLGLRHHETMRTEREFIEKQIKNMCHRKGVFLFVEVDGKLAGDTSIQPSFHHWDASPHVGVFGIMLAERFTGLGVGTRLTRKMLQLAKSKTRFKIIDSGFFSKNRRSEKLHKKFGFRQYGKFPKECLLRNGSYCDHSYAYKIIKKL